MSGFTRNPVLESLPDGRRVTVFRSFTFIRPNGERVTVEKGFTCDGLSQPFWLWGLKLSPYTGKSRDGAVVHDHLYTKQRTNRRPITRKEADVIFLEAMKARGTSWTVRRCKYLAVRWFSRGGWRPIPVTPSS